MRAVIDFVSPIFITDLLLMIRADLGFLDAFVLNYGRHVYPPLAYINSEHIYKAVYQSRHD